MNAIPKLRIGARGSSLALAQAHEVRDRLLAAHADLSEAVIEIAAIKTAGDRILDRPLSEVGGKGLFTREIDEAMLRGDIDIAVHSMKDVPTLLPDGIVAPCMLAREDVRDAFLSPMAASLADLPAGAVVGTASLRRKALVLARHPRLTVAALRGNIQTRLGKLAAGEVDATLLAVAGLNRMNMAHHATRVLTVEEMPPAIAQGAIGLTCRSADEAIHDRLASLNHVETFIRVSCERAFLRRLDGSCRTPFAGLARLSADGKRLSFRGLVIRPDGSEALEATRDGAASQAAALGAAAAEELLSRMGPGFLSAGTR